MDFHQHALSVHVAAPRLSLASSGKSALRLLLPRSTQRRRRRRSPSQAKESIGVSGIVPPAFAVGDERQERVKAFVMNYTQQQNIDNRRKSQCRRGSGGDGDNDDEDNVSLVNKQRQFFNSFRTCSDGSSNFSRSERRDVIRPLNCRSAACDVASSSFVSEQQQLQQYHRNTRQKEMKRRDDVDDEGGVVGVLAIPSTVALIYREHVRWSRREGVDVSVDGNDCSVVASAGGGGGCGDAIGDDDTDGDVKEHESGADETTHNAAAVHPTNFYASPSSSFLNTSLNTSSVHGGGSSADHRVMRHHNFSHNVSVGDDNDDDTLSIASIAGLSPSHRRQHEEGEAHDGSPLHSYHVWQRQAESILHRILVGEEDETVADTRSNKMNRLTVFRATSALKDSPFGPSQGGRSGIGNRVDSTCAAHRHRHDDINQHHQHSSPFPTVEGIGMDGNGGAPSAVDCSISMETNSFIPSGKVGSFDEGEGGEGGNTSAHFSKGIAQTIIQRLEHVLLSSSSAPPERPKSAGKAPPPTTTLRFARPPLSPSPCVLSPPSPSSSSFSPPTTTIARASAARNFSPLNGIADILTVTSGSTGTGKTRQLFGDSRTRPPQPSLHRLSLDQHMTADEGENTSSSSIVDTVLSSVFAAFKGAPHNRRRRLLVGISAVETFPQEEEEDATKKRAKGDAAAPSKESASEAAAGGVECFRDLVRASRRSQESSTHHLIHDDRSVGVVDDMCDFTDVDDAFIIPSAFDYSFTPPYPSIAHHLHHASSPPPLPSSIVHTTNSRLKDAADADSNANANDGPTSLRMRRTSEANSGIKPLTAYCTSFEGFQRVLFDCLLATEGRQWEEAEAEEDENEKEEGSAESDDEGERVEDDEEDDTIIEALPTIKANAGEGGDIDAFSARMRRVLLSSTGSVNRVAVGDGYGGDSFFIRKQKKKKTIQRIVPIASPHTVVAKDDDEDDKKGTNPQRRRSGKHVSGTKRNVAGKGHLILTLSFGFVDAKEINALVDDANLCSSSVSPMFGAQGPPAVVVWRIFDLAGPFVGRYTHSMASLYRSRTYASLGSLMQAGAHGGGGGEGGREDGRREDIIGLDGAPSLNHRNTNNGLRRMTKHCFRALVARLASPAMVSDRVPAKKEEGEGVHAQYPPSFWHDTTTAAKHRRRCRPFQCRIVDCLAKLVAEQLIVATVTSPPPSTITCAAFTPPNSEVGVGVDQSVHHRPQRVDRSHNSSHHSPSPLTHTHAHPHPHTTKVTLLSIHWLSCVRSDGLFDYRTRQELVRSDAFKALLNRIHNVHVHQYPYPSLDLPPLPPPLPLHSPYCINSNRSDFDDASCCAGTAGGGSSFLMGGGGGGAVDISRITTRNNTSQCSAASSSPPSSCIDALSTANSGRDTKEADCDTTRGDNGESIVSTLLASARETVRRTRRQQEEHVIISPPACSPPSPSPTPLRNSSSRGGGNDVGDDVLGGGGGLRLLKSLSPNSPFAETARGDSGEGGGGLSGTLVSQAKHQILNAHQSSDNNASKNNDTSITHRQHFDQVVVASPPSPSYSSVAIEFAAPSSCGLLFSHPSSPPPPPSFLSDQKVHHQQTPQQSKERLNTEEANCCTGEHDIPSDHGMATKHYDHQNHHHAEESERFAKGKETRHEHTTATKSAPRRHTAQILAELKRREDEPSGSQPRRKEEPPSGGVSKTTHRGAFLRSFSSSASSAATTTTVTQPSVARTTTTSSRVHTSSASALVAKAVTTTTRTRTIPLGDVVKQQQNHQHHHRRGHLLLSSSASAATQRSTSEEENVGVREEFHVNEGNAQIDRDDSRGEKDCEVRAVNERRDSADHDHDNDDNDDLPSHDHDYADDFDEFYDDEDEDDSFRENSKRIASLKKERDALTAALLNAPRDGILQRKTNIDVDLVVTVTTREEKELRTDLMSHSTSTSSHMDSREEEQDETNHHEGEEERDKDHVSDQLSVSGDDYGHLNNTHEVRRNSNANAHGSVAAEASNAMGDKPHPHTKRESNSDDDDDFDNDSDDDDSDAGDHHDQNEQVYSEEYEEDDGFEDDGRSSSKEAFTQRYHQTSTAVDDAFTHQQKVEELMVVVVGETTSERHERRRSSANEMKEDIKGHDRASSNVIGNIQPPLAMLDEEASAVPIISSFQHHDGDDESPQSLAIRRNDANMTDGNANPTRAIRSSDCTAMSHASNTTTTRRSSETNISPCTSIHTTWQDELRKAMDAIRSNSQPTTASAANSANIMTDVRSDAVLNRVSAVKASLMNGREEMKRKENVETKERRQPRETAASHRTLVPPPPLPESLQQQRMGEDRSVKKKSHTKTISTQTSPLSTHPPQRPSSSSSSSSSSDSEAHHHHHHHSRRHALQSENEKLKSLLQEAKKELSTTLKDQSRYVSQLASDIVDPLLSYYDAERSFDKAVFASTNALHRGVIAELMSRGEGGGGGEVTGTVNEDAVVEETPEKKRKRRIDRSSRHHNHSDQHTTYCHYKHPPITNPHSKGSEIVADHPYAHPLSRALGIRRELRVGLAPSSCGSVIESSTPSSSTASSTSSQRSHHDHASSSSASSDVSRGASNNNHSRRGGNHIRRGKDAEKDGKSRFYHGLVDTFIQQSRNEVGTDGEGEDDGEEEESYYDTSSNNYSRTFRPPSQQSYSIHSASNAGSGRRAPSPSVLAVDAVIAKESNTRLQRENAVLKQRVHRADRNAHLLMGLNDASMAAASTATGRTFLTRTSSRTVATADASMLSTTTARRSNAITHTHIDPFTIDNSHAMINHRQFLHHHHRHPQRHLMVGLNSAAAQSLSLSDNHHHAMDGSTGAMGVVSHYCDDAGNLITPTETFRKVLNKSGQLYEKSVAKVKRLTSEKLSLLETVAGLEEANKSLMEAKERDRRAMTVLSQRVGALSSAAADADEKGKTNKKRGGEESVSYGMRQRGKPNQILLLTELLGDGCVVDGGGGAGGSRGGGGGGGEGIFTFTALNNGDDANDTQDSSEDDDDDATHANGFQLSEDEKVLLKRQQAHDDANSLVGVSVAQKLMDAVASLIEDVDSVAAVSTTTKAEGNGTRRIEENANASLLLATEMAQLRDRMRSQHVPTVACAVTDVHSQLVGLRAREKQYLNCLVTIPPPPASQRSQQPHPSSSLSRATKSSAAAHFSNVDHSDATHRRQGGSSRRRSASAVSATSVAQRSVASSSLPSTIFPLRNR